MYFSALSYSNIMVFDLLSTIEYGGCSAKLSPKDLKEVLDKLPLVKHPNLLVDIETHDDAGVYKISEEQALIFTTDFFPPICSDGYLFGQIAATNAISDVYAMGGKPLLALNILMFSSSKIPIEVYSEIMRGGFEKVSEAGALTIGGHTIDDHPPKYGLAVVGFVHPERIMTNAGVKPGDKLILTKPLGTGIVVAGKRNNLIDLDIYKLALNQMSLLNDMGAEIAQKYNVKGATDITGFGLLGHAMKMAEA